MFVDFVLIIGMALLIFQLNETLEDWQKDLSRTFFKLTDNILLH